MWSHYSDILSESNASSAYTEWANLMHLNSGIALDAGSAAGRYTFEMSKKSDFAIGVDNSLSFIQSARELMINHQMKIDLLQEGVLTKKNTLDLPDTWDSDKIEFIVGDALALPFRSKTFSSLASLNLIDKVPLPIKHLKEIPEFIKLQEKFGAKGLQFIGIAIDDASEVENFVEMHDVNYPVLVGEAEASDIAFLYGNHLGVLPFSVVIDRKGMIVSRHKGELTPEKLEEIILPLL